MREKIISILTKIDDWLYTHLGWSFWLGKIHAVDICLILFAVLALVFFSALVIAGIRKRGYKKQNKEYKIKAEKARDAAIELDQQISGLKADLQKAQAALKSANKSESDKALELEDTQTKLKDTALLLEQANGQIEEYKANLEMYKAKYEALVLKTKTAKKKQAEKKRKEKIKAKKQAEIEAQNNAFEEAKATYMSERAQDLQKLYKEYFNESAFGKTKEAIAEALAKDAVNNLN